ncbi:hypothetical protein GGF32_008466, partial [Allomyces javanicus]
MVRDVMCQSGMMIAGVRLEPGDYCDTIPTHDRPQPHAVFVLFHIPTNHEDLLEVLRSMHLPSALLDSGTRLPVTKGFPAVSYAFLSVLDQDRERIERLDGIWVGGKQLRVFWLENARSLFAIPAQVMDVLRAMASVVVAGEDGSQDLLLD